MNFAIIIQARTGSRRFPKKILARIDRRNVLEFFIDRLLQTFSKNNIIIATTKFKRDNIVCNISKKNKIKFYRGPEKNVLKRFLNCAKKFNVKNIARVTPDCPLVDPRLLQSMKKQFFIRKLDYLANTNPPTKSKFPDGSDIEIFKFRSLQKIYRLSKNKDDREHVTHLFWKNPKKFKIKIINKKKNISNYKFSIDYKHDLLLVKKVINKIKISKKYGNADEIVNIIKHDKKLNKISEMSRRKSIKNRNDLTNFI